MKTQDAKKSPKIAIWAPSHNFVGLYLHIWGTYRQSEKNLLSSNISSTCPHNMVNFGPLATEIDPVVWGTLQISTGFASWQRYCTASSSGRQPNFAALNRGRHLCSAGQPSRWALAHILVAVYLDHIKRTEWDHHFSFIRACQTMGKVKRLNSLSDTQSSLQLTYANSSDGPVPFINLIS